MLCDRVTIFRDGAHISTDTIDVISDDEIIKLMIGRTLKKYMRKHKAEVGEIAMEVSSLSLPGKFENISFSLRRGEIIGLGGLVGAGRTDVARALFGVSPRQMVR